LRIGAIDLAVAIVIHAVITDLGNCRLAGGIEGTVAVGAVDLSVAIVIHPIGAVLGNARETDGIQGAIGVRTIDFAVAIIVHAVVAMPHFWIAGIAQAITIGIHLSRIEHRRAIIRAVRDPVAI